MFSLGLTIIAVFTLILFTACIIIEVNPEGVVARASSTILQQEEEEELHAVETFQDGFCGINDTDNNSTEFVTEYMLPQTCEMPLGIGVDIEEDRVWYVSTKKGVLGSYGIKENKFNEEKQIPSWPSRENPRE